MNEQSFKSTPAPTESEDRYTKTVFKVDAALLLLYHQEFAQNKVQSIMSITDSHDFGEVNLISIIESNLK